MLNLTSLVQDLDIKPEECQGFLNKVTGETLFMDSEMEDYISEKDTSHLPAWKQEILGRLREAHISIDWIALPDGFDIDSYELMNDFIKIKVVPNQQEELFNTIKGRGAFRRFKDKVFDMDLEKKWYAFEEEETKKVVAIWLEENGIPYEEEKKNR